ncbi:MAG: restriction endonuclease subunit S [Comamonadaceae bacterium]|nr:restriction endonuclease subunit S [Comamonadaceae bacterium]
MSSNSDITSAKEEAVPARVPKLRFPEFRAASPWENKLIGPYLEDCSGRVPPDTKLPIYSSTREGLKRQDAYFDGRVLQNKNEYGMVPPGCFVYRHMSDDGLFKFNLNETGDEIAVSKEYPVFSTKGLNPGFLLAKLNDGLDFKHFALKQKAGGTRTRLYFSRLCEWLTLLPSPAEQQKIADCLSSVDELIAAQARKVDALKAHKKGLMQQLFPREGETQPRLRFPEFQNAGKWEVRAIGDVFRVTRGEVLSMTLVQDVASSEAPFPVYSSQTKNKGLAGYYSEHLYEDAITWTTDGANAGDVNFRPGKFYCTNVCGVLINTKGYANDCVAALLNSVTRSHVSYVGNPKLMNGVMAKIEIPFPSVPEQQRIATCLGSIEALTMTETEKFEALKTHKKGLMQQLFPSVEEKNEP